jgi:hypothetical protein
LATASVPTAMHDIVRPGEPPESTR